MVELFHVADTIRNFHDNKREISFKIQSKSVEKSVNQIQDIAITHFEVMCVSFAENTFRGMEFVRVGILKTRLRDSEGRKYRVVLVEGSIDE